MEKVFDEMIWGMVVFFLLMLLQKEDRFLSDVMLKFLKCDKQLIGTMLIRSNIFVKTFSFCEQCGKRAT